MANWALIEDGEIKELHDLLPQNWRNVSGLRLAENDPEFLQSLGWYGVEKQYEQYDSSLLEVQGYAHQFNGDAVIETLLLRDAPVPATLSVDQSFSDLREKRNRLLAESDWTQLADVQLTEQQKQQWSSYRQALRDFPSKFANTLSYFEVQGIVWPRLDEF